MRPSPVLLWSRNPIRVALVPLSWHWRGIRYLGRLSDWRSYVSLAEGFLISLNRTESRRPVIMWTPKTHGKRAGVEEGIGRRSHSKLRAKADVESAGLGWEDLTKPLRSRATNRTPRLPPFDYRADRHHDYATADDAHQNQPAGIVRGVGRDGRQH